MTRKFIAAFTFLSAVGLGGAATWPTPHNFYLIGVAMPGPIPLPQPRPSLEMPIVTTVGDIADPFGPTLPRAIGHPSIRRMP
jgi:hypothetical protein